MKQPFLKTWWVKDGQLLAGCFPGTEAPNGTKERLANLVASGIRTFVSLQTADECNTRTLIPFPHYETILSELEGEAGEPLEFHRFPVPDCTAPTPAIMAEALDVIDESLAGGKPVYVHCWGGHGRTGTVIACWLVRHGASAAEALSALTLLRKRYPELVGERAPQVPPQYDLVRVWAKLDSKTARPHQDVRTITMPTAPATDPVVNAYLDSEGMTTVNKPDPRHFQFQLGQKFHAASDGGVRRIRGFCLGRDKVPLYVVELPGNKLTTKTAEKAHREYVPGDQKKAFPVGKDRSIPSSPKMATSSPLLIGVEPLSLHDRYLGAMFGLACGDAVGTTLEFKSPGSFTPISDMIGGGPFGLLAGQWTDDTSMALCLAESLVHVGESHVEDQMQRYVAWWKQGHLSSTGKFFDIGGATSAALSRFMLNGDPMAGSTDPNSAGNGSLMRLAPIPLAYRVNVDSAIDIAARTSMTTHAAIEAVDACRYMTVLMIRALEGASKEELLDDNLWEKSLHYPTQPLAPNVLAVAKGSYKTKKPPALKGTGYVVDCLEAALWGFYHQEDYEKTVLAAANLGDDADTTAAVCGQLAGAYYGLTGIPSQWVERVALRDTIAQLSRGLLALSKLLNEQGL